MLSPLIFRFLSSFFFSFFYLFFFSNTFFFCVCACVCLYVCVPAHVCVCMCVLWSEGLKVINSSMKQSFNPEDMHDDEFDMQSM